MEIIRIGNDSFKISLNAKEAQKYDFSSLVSTNSEDMTLSLKDLINTVKNENGIDLGNDKMCVEIYLSNDGGCDIFVSKSPDLNKISKQSLKNGMRAIYSFDNLENLIEVCARLKCIDFDKTATVYYSKESKKYYLELKGIFHKDLKYAFISEYGIKIKNIMSSYIIEMSDCICENNSVEIFSKLL